ncbi:N-acetylglucosamine-specific PTS transporter subunit IIBC [Agarivorans aestuarii]|uniref:N-acetylglucosamine-specific PTS transporter subunit IIBC n=1 Tax=Agarivorans aestuarii TaxID=1563703 RepID=A0ABU7FZH4_9ALTE|nr:N-acetylglucosamine-specific PTS transporter subunit IIBC [Agarivorans aestuarii]MEE1672510.1 N-acetylglucosamine-specific PTS transporter subunit IIBC [Agarivorans aestuarii]
MFSYLQKIGRALMVPVAVLPAAAILMGIGYWIDPNGWGGNSALAAFLIKSGAAIIDNMSVLFAIGIAYGMSRDKDGAAALAGFIGYMVITTLLSPGAVEQIGLVTLNDASTLAFSKIENQFVGIISGIMAAELYNRFYQVELHKALSFFSGKRLVPILTSVAGIAVAFVLMYIWPLIFGGLVSFGESITGMGSVGAGIYGFFNRLLIPVGLHHALNAVFWFDMAGINDLGKFLSVAADAVPGETGRYMAGFFPIMMFGLPGAALAIYHTAKAENKSKVASIMIAAATASFFTGVTEPLEFAFMFVAPVLYVVHALLTGISVFIAASMQWMAGFGFSAGLVDMVLSSRNPLATNWYMLIPQGLVFFAVYYFVFKTMIIKMNLKTPGREDASEEETTLSVGGSHSDTADLVLTMLGGTDNVVLVDNCATRLRLEVKDSDQVNVSELKKHVPGVIVPSKTAVQVVIGPHVEFVANELKLLAAK